MINATVRNTIAGFCNVLKPVPLIMILIATLLTGACGPNIPGTINELVTSLRYEPLTPPPSVAPKGEGRGLYSPGAVIVHSYIIETTKDVVTPICGSKETVNLSISDPEMIPAGRFDIRADITEKSNFNADAELTKKISAGIDSDMVKITDIKLENPRVYNLTVPEILNGSFLCTRPLIDMFVNSYRDDDDKLITMIQSVLVADVVYSLEYNNDLTAAAKADLQEELKTKLNADIQYDEDSSFLVSGESLILGYRENKRFLEVYLDALDGQGS